ncbi:hypothetical protein QQX98_010061 [Neonectria punicea]|uniref:FAD-binding domain-containing protein n=1 Tax=Neonectria punicea TaxID=979145 RepID=A0ABR1GQI0_9HYPO
MSLRVICVGAGIAGLSTAIALREHAASITLLEASESVESMNIRAAGLTVYTCGANIMRDTLGLDPVGDVSAVQGHSIRAINWTSGSLDREIVPPTDDWYMAHRGSLLDALRSRATSPGGKGRAAKLLLGKIVTEIDVEAGRVLTSDGSVFEGDLIVGGDGVRSETRKAVVDKAIVQPSGLSIYRWTLTPVDWAGLPDKGAIDALIGPEARCIVTSDAKDMRLVTYRCHSSGLVNGALILPDHRLPFTSEDWTTAGSVEHLQSLVQDMGEPLKRIVGCVKSCGLWQLRKQAPLRTWFKAKAIILGDAAHPMLPFQAVAGALAMEDAEALQYALGQVGWIPARVPEALDLTFRLRFLRCSVIQHFSNSSPFDAGTMEKASTWSLENTATNAVAAVPLARDGADDKVQQAIATRVNANAGAFDVRATSGWVMNYKSAAAFSESQAAYILDKAFV